MPLRCAAAKGQAQARGGPRQETEYRETSVFRLFVPDRPAIGSLSRPRGRRERERRDGDRTSASVVRSWDRIEQKGAGRTRPESTPESPFLSDFRTDQFFSLPLSLLQEGEISKLRGGNPRIRISRRLDFSILPLLLRGGSSCGVDHPRTRSPFCPPPPLIGPPVYIKREVGCADRPARPHESKVERNKLGRRVDIEGGKNSSRVPIDRPRRTIAPRVSTDPRLRGCCHASPFALAIRSGNRPRLPRTPVVLLFTIIVDRVSSPSFLSFFLFHRSRYRRAERNFPSPSSSPSWNCSAREKKRGMARYSRISCSISEAVDCCLNTL